MSDGSSKNPPAKISLQEKLTEWFSKQGYPLEYEVADTAQQCGYTARLGERIEWSDKKPREIDVIASQRRNLQCGNVNAELIFSLLVECKYRGTNKPWIGMCQAETRRNVQLASVPSLHDGLWRICARACIDGLTEWHRLSWISGLVEHPICYSIVEAAMKSDKNDSAGVNDKETNTDAAFEIGLKVSEAARLLKPYTDFRRFGGHFDVASETVEAQHTIPTVVVNGPLFSAHFDRERRKVVIEPARVLRMHWNHGHHAVIYIVQRDAWSDFLEQIRAVQDAYFHETTSIISDPKFPDFIMDVSRDRTSTDQLFAKVSST